MHMLSRKDLNSAELDTLRVSRNPTMVIPADREVQTNKEATVHVNDVDVFVTIQILEDTPAILSFGNICEDRGYSYEWTSGQKTNLTDKCRKNHCNTENHVPIVVPGLSTGTSSSTASTSPTSLTQVKRRLLHFSSREVIVNNEHNRPLLLQRRRHRLTDESPQKALAPE